MYDECMSWCAINKICVEENMKKEAPKIFQLVDSDYMCDNIDTPQQCFNEEKPQNVQVNI